MSATTNTTTSNKEVRTIRRRTVITILGWVLWSKVVTVIVRR